MIGITIKIYLQCELCYTMCFINFFNASLYLAYDVPCLNSMWWWVCIYFVNNCSFVLCFVDFLIKSSFKHIQH